MQEYPKNDLEVFVIDNESKDKTLEIAKEFPVKIIINDKIKDAQVSTRLAYKVMKGELYLPFGADQRMVGTDWLKKMVLPFMENKDVVGSFFTYKIKGDESPLTRFLTLDWYSKDHFNCQRTPMYKFFTASIRESFIEKRERYYICQLKEGRIPPMPVGVSRKSFVDKTLYLQGNKLMELDTLVHLVRAGYDKFAYVPVGCYHYFVKDMRTLFRKRFRNIRRNYR